MTRAPAAGSRSRARAGSANFASRRPSLIRFGDETQDEVFITHEAAQRGIEVENTGHEPLVSLRYFGPDTFESVPNVGDFRLG